MEFSNVEKELLRNLGKQNGETRKTSDSGNTDAGIGKKRKRDSATEGEYGINEIKGYFKGYSLQLYRRY